MGLPVEVNPLFLENQYAIQRSLRFRQGSSNNAYLSRTPASTTSGTKCTFSAWIKLGSLTSGTNNGTVIGAADNYYYFQYYNNSVYFGNSVYAINTAAIYRDFSSWYHVFFVVDTTLATTNDRTQIWVNGVRQAVGSFNTQPAQNATFTFLNSNQLYYIGARSSGNYFDGYLAEVNFIDGLALTPSSFGQYNEFGVWSPRKYGGSYGTNGFYLQFTDIALTSGSNAGLGKDFSGNTNYWTTNNISVTPGTTYDAMTDVPPPLTIQNVRAGNYATLNPLVNAGSTISNANLTITASTGYDVTGTQSPNYKCYFEMTIASSAANSSRIGMGDVSVYNPWVNNFNSVNGAFGVIAQTGKVYVNGVNTATYSTAAANDVVGFAFDPATGKFWYSVNGVWANSGDPDAGTGNVGTGTVGLTYVPVFAFFTSTSGSVNFGQRPFSYSPSSTNKNSTFYPINTNNLPSPTIPNGARVMAATTYAGTSSSNPVSNSSNNTLGTTFQPDFVWIKNRNYGAGTNHVLIDSVRGISNGLASNLTNGDFSTTGNFSSINPTGFTVAGTARDYNFLNDTFVGWQWLGGGTPTVNNTAGAGNVPTAGSVLINGANSTSALAGSIAATRLSANTPAGFSVVTYTGNGTSGATVGHGLGVAPSMILVKCRNSALNWCVYHASIGNTNFLILDTTAAASASSTAWNNTTPSSSFYTVGAGGLVNANTNTYVAYCFAPVAGYSAFGSYTGNNSADGPFVYLGFRPRFLMIKDTTSASAWWIGDSSRATYNVVAASLFPNTSGAESSVYNQCDFLSNGFKWRANNANSWPNNVSGNTYIYAAFAENPFRMALAR